MVSFLENYFFEIIVLILGLILIFLLVFLFRKSTKKEGTFLFLKTSDEFEQEMKNLMTKEMRRIIGQLNEDIQSFATATFETYKKEVTFLPKKIEEHLSELSQFNQILKEKLSMEMEKRIEEFERNLSETQTLLLREIEGKAKESLDKISQDIKDFYLGALKPLTKKIEEVEKEIENYKREKMKEVEEKIFEIIKKVAKKTIGKTLDLSAHEKLVMEALEKAKKEKIL